MNLFDECVALFKRPPPNGHFPLNPVIRFLSSIQRHKKCGVWNTPRIGCRQFPPGGPVGWSTFPTFLFPRNIQTDPRTLLRYSSGRSTTSTKKKKSRPGTRHGANFFSGGLLHPKKSGQFFFSFWPFISIFHSKAEPNPIKSLSRPEINILNESSKVENFKSVPRIIINDLKKSNQF